MNTGQSHIDADLALKTQLRESMMQQHGPLMGGESLAAALGHRSMASLRQARHRKQISIHLFPVPHRRGWFALTLDVADWLAGIRIAAAADERSQSN